MKRAWPYLLVSVLAVLAATLLPGNAIEAGQAPPRWCLACGGLWVMDAVSNLLLFAPLGAALGHAGVRWPLALLGGGALSLTVESLQSVGIPPGRSAALADIVTNVAGTGLGYLALRWTRPLVLARGRAAMRLTISWLLLVAATLLIASLALGPRSGSAIGGAVRTPVEPAAPAAADDYRLSPYEYSPGFGWYDGRPRHAEVNGRTFNHQGEGPIVVEIAHEPVEVTLRASVLGRDPASNTRAFLYVHRRGDTSAVAMLAQKGDDAVLSVTRRAWDWGLAMPGARVRGAFAPRDVSDSTPLVLEAYAARDRLVLTEVTRGHTGEVPLYPTIGWAMIQTLVSIHHPLAPIVQAAWLLTLFLPLGWWAMRSGRDARWILPASLVAVTGLFPLLRVTFGVASLPPGQWFIIAASIALGALGARWSLRGNIRP